MKQRLESYRNLERDLLRQIDLCNRYKQQIEVTLHDLQRLHNAGHIDQATHQQQVHHFLQGKQPHEWHAVYDQHIERCHHMLASCREKIGEFVSYADKSRNSFSLFFAILAILFAIGGVFTFTDVSLTGFFGVDNAPLNIVAEDGSSQEGLLWTNINGSQIYSRCMEISSPTEFTAVNIAGKITSAVDEKHLALSLHKNNPERNEPGEEIGSCSVRDYAAVWKACRVKTEILPQGKYWICAKSSEGDFSQIYYLLDYRFGVGRKTALWTGSHWQKLDGIAYTMKAQFLKP